MKLLKIEEEKISLLARAVDTDTSNFIEASSFKLKMTMTYCAYDNYVAMLIYVKY